MSAHGFSQRGAAFVAWTSARTPFGRRIVDGISWLGAALREVFGASVGDGPRFTDPEKSEPGGRWSPREIGVSRWIVRIATAWFVLVAAWELFGPILSGHYAALAGMGIIAENMHHWRILGPVWTYTADKPTPDLYYCHHPWGGFWITGLFYEVFGRHDFVCRLPAVVLSAVTPSLFAAISRALYRPYAGAATALGFVVLPITLSFASFNTLEVPVTAFSALFLWAYVRLVETSKRRYLIAGVVAATLALNADWPAFVLVGAILAAELCRMLFGARASSPMSERRRAQFWALCATISVFTIVMYVHLFRDAGKLDDFLGSYKMRSAGNHASLASVLYERRYWIELMFTPPAIAIGKVFAVVATVRLAVRRRIIEVVPLAVLLMATVQYVIFKEGADVHIFWPHYFASYFALAIGGAVATLASGLRVVGRRFDKIGRHAGFSALGAAVVVLALVLRDGVQALVYAHATGGRFNEKGNRIQSDGDKVKLLGWLAPRYRVVGLHDSMDATWADVWAIGGRPVPLSAGPPATGSDAVTVVDSRFVPDAAKSSWLHTYAVTAVGPYWVMGAPTGSAQSSPTVLGFAETEPSLFERYFITAMEPHREIAADPYAAWELLDHYDMSPTLPPREPQTFEEHRIRYNIAISSGDAERAATEKSALFTTCQGIDATFSDGTTLLCARFHDGAAPTLSIVFETPGPLGANAELSVRSRVVEQAKLSTTMRDPVVRELGYPFSLAPSRFKRGFLYDQVVTIRSRPGVEVFEAAWKGRGAPATDHPVVVLRH